MIKHKSNCNNENCTEYNYFIYQHIRQNGGWFEFSHEILETVECTKKDSKVYERKWVDHYDAKMNKHKPGQTHSESCKQYYQTNKQTINEKQKQYYQTNKQVITVYKKQKFDCPCGGRYTKTNKAQHRKSNKHKQYIQTL
jgi:hypothetical protein